MRIAGTKQMPWGQASRMNPSRPYPKARKREEYTVYKPKRIKVMPLARKEAAPTAVIAALLFAKRPSMGEENRVQERPKNLPSIVWRFMASSAWGLARCLAVLFFVLVVHALYSFQANNINCDKV